MARNSMQQAMLNKSRADKFLLVFDIPPILKEFNKNLIKITFPLLVTLFNFLYLGQLFLKLLYQLLKQGMQVIHYMFLHTAKTPTRLLVLNLMLIMNIKIIG
jgi:hypothetical protein